MKQCLLHYTEAFTCRFLFNWPTLLELIQDRPDPNGETLQVAAAGFLWTGSVVSERNQHCGGEASPEGQKLEGLSQGCGSWRGAVSPLPSSERVWGSAVSTPKSFGAFWILQVSSTAVLLLHLGLIHSSFCGSARKFSGWLAGSSCKISNYCGTKRYFCPRGFSIAGQAPPLPLWFQRLWTGCHSVARPVTSEHWRVIGIRC